MSHRWRFFRAGGFDQVQLDTGEDLCALPELDLKLWVALSCPTRGVEFDDRTLAFLDGDHDGRVRASDVLQAVRWTDRLIRDKRSLTRREGGLRLDEIDASHADGEKLVASARRILTNLGRPEAVTIAPADTADTARVFAGTRFNGDGVITLDSAGDDFDARATIELVMGKLGGVADASGSQGVDQDEVDRFFTAVEARRTWMAAAPATPAFADGAGAAWAAFAAVRDKVDDFFARVALAEMDGAASAALNPGEDAYRALGREHVDEHAAAVAALPLAHVTAGARLPLGAHLNPAWTDAVHALRDRVLAPVLGAPTPPSSLGADEWRRVTEAMARHEAWAESRPAGDTDHKLDDLDDAKIAALAAPAAKAALDSLIAQDKALAPELQAIGDVDRLVHFHQHLYAFANQFVAFRDFYSRRGRGMFQTGTLYLDGRSAELCIRVEDVAKHAVLAVHSMTYLAYCDCTRRDTTPDAVPEKLSLVAAFTAGDSDFLMVGRNGVFIDRKGRDWDATVMRVVEQPISVRQAFFAPYKRVSKLVSEQIEKVAGRAEGEHAIGSVVQAAGAAPSPAAPPAPVPFDVAKFAGIFAAIGLALGTIGSAIAAVVSGFLGLRPWQMPLAVSAALLVVSGPSMLLASMKLRQRNLGPLLDASGWAINARARLNVPFGRTLTGLGALPPGAERRLRDPYAGRRSWVGWLIFVVLLAVAVWAVKSGRFSALVSSLRDTAAEHAKPAPAPAPVKTERK
jgi:hypothetical protein